MAEYQKGHKTYLACHTYNVITHIEHSRRLQVEPEREYVDFVNSNHACYVPRIKV